MDAHTARVQAVMKLLHGQDDLAMDAFAALVEKIALADLDQLASAFQHWMAFPVQQDDTVGEPQA